VASSWPGGFVGEVTVTADRPLSGWRVTLSVPAGASFTNGWNAALSGSTGTVVATNLSFNGTLSAGQSTKFGLQATGSPSGITASCAG
jgi:endo-1,4-beta-xylanase